MNIAVGITTAPREKPTLGECLHSIREGGFENPYVFADGYRPALESRCTVRPKTIAPPRYALFSKDERHGAWRNWVQSLEDLLAAEPDAEAVMLVQDDVRFCRGVRDFLDDGHWMLDSLGAVTLCTSYAYRGIARRRGLNLLSENRTVIAGAWTLLMPRAVASLVLAHELCDPYKGWQYRKTGDPSKAKHIDMAAGMILLDRGLKIYGYRPSLAEHFGETSTINDGGGLTGNRATLSFAGIDADAQEAISGELAEA